MHDLKHEIFGRLKVLFYAGVTNKKRYWMCECLCGNRCKVMTWKLVGEHTKSCGCLAQETRGKAQITHGETRGPRNRWSARTKMLYAAKARAKKDGLPFSIVLDDIVVPDMCPVLGIPIIKNSGRCQPNSPSLDKTIPQNGYVRGNVEVISHKANTIKSDATIEELEKVLVYMKSKRGQ
jgi:hypothetical protein